MLTHALPHLVKPELHAKLQLLDVQMGYPFAGAGVQALPQPPQFGSWVGFTQEAPHLSKPALQVNPQAPAEQVAVAPLGAAQALPQAPQFSTSEPVATHCPLQLVVPVGQLSVHTPFEQTFPDPQAVPHAPQLLLSVCLFTHALPHSESPVPQLGVHVPLAHAMLPPVGAAGQALPQAPQLLLSVAVLTQAPLHLV